MIMASALGVRTLRTTEFQVCLVVLKATCQNDDISGFSLSPSPNEGAKSCCLLVQDLRNQALMSIMLRYLEEVDPGSYNGKIIHSPSVLIDIHLSVFCSSTTIPIIPARPQAHTSHGDVETVRRCRVMLLLMALTLTIRTPMSPRTKKVVELRPALFPIRVRGLADGPALRIILIDFHCKKDLLAKMLLRI